MGKAQVLKLAALALFIGLAALFLLEPRANAIRDPSVPDVQRLREKPPLPGSRFSPSNARTEDGNIIPIEDFISAKRCASCHQETHTGWSESLHRNAAREPFYKASVDMLERQRGIEFTAHCESCHAPTAMLSGALVTGSKVSREMDDEGVTCVVCHSITDARTDGTGSYTIRRPALIVGKDGTPVYGDLPDNIIMADVEGHKRAMMRPILKSPEFCATCHKGSAPPELNNYKFTRGFNAYDEWQMSGASTESITPYYRKDKRADCRTCHMPSTAALKDVAAKKGAIVSHRFIGANTAAPLFYKQMDQVELTRKFLEDGVISVDIFALHNESNGKVFSALEPGKGNTIAIQPGDTVTASVVVFNRRAAHSFPPELRDMYEPWVEFEAIDENGTTVFHSGFIKPDGTLDESSHVYKAILVDIDSRVITRHQVWFAAIKAYDNFIPPGRADLARYRFSLPKGDFSKVTLRARVNYRRFIQEYADYVQKLYGIGQLDNPIVQMAETTVQIVSEKPSKTFESKVTGRKSSLTVSENAGSQSEQLAKRWNDYGIALLEQSQFGAACEAFKKASEFDSQNPDPYISAAIAELRMERYNPEREQVEKALALVEAALKVKPELPRAIFYRAVLWRAAGRVFDAAAEFEKLAVAYPRDREVQRQYGQTRYSLSQFGDAKSGFEAILSIDPTDSGAYQFLASIYASEGRGQDSALSHKKYLLWRDDPLSSGIAAQFFALNPQWAEVRVPYHFYSPHTPQRPVATGVNAAPAE